MFTIVGGIIIAVLVLRFWEEIIAFGVLAIGGLLVLVVLAAFAMNTCSSQNEVRTPQQVTPAILPVAPGAGGLPNSGKVAGKGDPIFVCTDADGHRSYQNHSEGPQCRVVDPEPLKVPGKK